MPEGRWGELYSPGDGDLQEAPRLPIKNLEVLARITQRYTAIKNEMGMLIVGEFDDGRPRTPVLAGYSELFWAFSALASNSV